MIFGKKQSYNAILRMLLSSPFAFLAIGIFHDSAYIQEIYQKKKKQIVIFWKKRFSRIMKKITGSTVSAI